MNVLRVKFATIEEAEVNFGLTINSILHGTSEPAESPKVTTAFHNVNILTELKNFGVGELVHVLKGTLQLLEPMQLESMIMSAFGLLTKEEKFGTLDKLFSDLSQLVGINAKLRNFVSMSIEAMDVLQNAGKPNLVYKWAKCIAGENGVPLMPLSRMPFGLIQYQMEFFTSTNIMQV